MKRVEISEDLLQNLHPKWRERERGKREKKAKNIAYNACFVCAFVCGWLVVVVDVWVKYLPQTTKRRRRCCFCLLAQIYGAFSKGKKWNRAGFDENGIKLKFSVQKWKRSWLRVLKTVLVKF